MTSIEIQEKIEELFRLRTEICKPIDNKILELLQEVRLQLERERKESCGPSKPNHLRITRNKN